jgi:hypothetical protein
MYFADNGPSILDPPKWTKGGASVIRGCRGHEGGAFEVNFHLYLNLRLNNYVTMYSVGFKNTG